MVGLIKCPSIMKKDYNECKKPTDIMWWLRYLAVCCRIRSPPSKPAVEAGTAGLENHSQYAGLEGLREAYLIGLLSDVRVFNRGMPAIWSARVLLEIGCNQISKSSFGYGSNVIFPIILYRGPLCVRLVHLRIYIITSSVDILCQKQWIRYLHLKYLQETEFGCEY